VKVIIVCLAVVLAVSLVGCGGGGGSKPTLTYSGVVVDSETDLPLSGVTVRVDTPPYDTATTDAQGRFSVSGRTDESGIFQIRFTRTGYDEGIYRSRPNPSDDPIHDTVHIELARITSEVKFYLTGYVVSGGGSFIPDGGYGTPIEGATVEITTVGTSTNKETLTTYADGSFTFVYTGTEAPTMTYMKISAPGFVEQNHDWPTTGIEYGSYITDWCYFYLTPVGN
jgi:hypothetical protein